MNDNISQVHGTETEEGETISDSMRERMDDWSEGMDTMKIDGHSRLDTAEEMEAVTGMTDGLEDEKRREKGRKDSMTGSKQSHNTGKCPSGGWGQLNTMGTICDTVIQ